MRVIGLTGGIACGKSTFSSILRGLGAPVVDADAISRSLTARDGAALPSIRGRFGGGVFDPDGRLNRRALGDIVFNNESARRALESIIHPLVIEESVNRLASLRDSGARAAILEAPLLIESNMRALCDEVWLVYVPESVQLARLMERDNISIEQARARVLSQTTFRQKARHASLIIPMLGSRPGICETASRQWRRVTEGDTHDGYTAL
jgi:dephospho-CoA kinase